MSRLVLAALALVMAGCASAPKLEGQAPTDFFLRDQEGKAWSTAELKDKTPEERKAWLDAKTQERAELQKQIVELSKKREQYIADELAKRGGKDGFDSVVKDALRKQAEKKGIEFSK